MPEIRTDTCRSCKYASKLDDGRLECRFNAPTVAPVIAPRYTRSGDGYEQTGGELLGQYNVNPVISPDYWCGQFGRKLIASH